MNEWKTTWLSAAAALLAVAGVVFLDWDRSPVYRGRALEHWIEASSSPDYEERRNAEAALEPLGAEALPALVRALQAKDSTARVAWQGLRGHLSGAAPPHVPRAPIRAKAAGLIARLGADAQPACPMLIERLADDSPEVTRAVERALRHLGPAAVPRLIRALRHENPTVRSAAAGLLGEAPAYGDALTNAAGPLVEALTDRQPAVRSRAATSLGRSARGSHLAVMALVSALSDDDDSVRAAAAAALGEASPTDPAALAGLRPALTDRCTLVRVAAARSLWEIGKDPSVTTTLVAALEDPDAHWRAALALREVGPAAADAAVPALLKELCTEPVHRPSRTPATAALALAWMGPKAVPGLTELLAHADVSVRVGAAMALVDHGPEASPCVPALIRLLDDREPEAQIAAVETLGRIGPAAEAAVPRLANLAQSAEDYLRAAARTAIVRIRDRPETGARQWTTHP